MAPPESPAALPLNVTLVNTGLLVLPAPLASSYIAPPFPLALLPLNVTLVRLGLLVPAPALLNKAPPDAAVLPLNVTADSVGLLTPPLAPSLKMAPPEKTVRLPANHRLLSVGLHSWLAPDPSQYRPPPKS